MKALSKGVIIVKKKRKQSQEEFRDYVCGEYDELFEKILLPRGVYNELYRTIKEYAREKEEDKDFFENKMNRFVGIKLRLLVELSNTKDELPIPDISFFIALYSMCKKNNSAECVKGVLSEFISAIDELIRQIDIAYDSLFCDENKECVKTLTKSKEQNRDEFQEAVNEKYIDLFMEFLLSGGAYSEFYATLRKFARERGEEELFVERVNKLPYSIEKLKEITSKKNEAPVPNNAFFRALYYKCMKLHNSSKEIELVTNEFLLAIDDITQRIDDAFNKL